MANDFLKNMPPALKSLWQLENELRRALQSAVLLRKDDAQQNLERARLHIEAAVLAVKGEYPKAESASSAAKATTNVNSSSR
jgi:hypothetical protein